MKNNDLLLLRIRELNSLLNKRNLIVCIHPFSFVIKEFIKSNADESIFDRIFTSSIEETKKYLTSNKNEYLIFISENLKDGKGTKLLKLIKDLKTNHKCIIFLSGKDKNNLNVALQLKSDGIIHEESLEKKNGSLVKALKNIFIGQRFIDPEIKKIQEEKNIENSSNLTNRHIEIIKLVKEGLTNQEIANKLFISPNTVRDHLKEIMKRLNTNTRVGVVDISNRIGIIN